MRHTIVALLLSLAVFACPLLAGDMEKDTRLSRIAYSTLQADPELADLNLGVRVEQGGVAVLWGLVPSKQHSLRAEKAMEGIRGLTAIKNQCELIPQEDTFLREVSAALKGNSRSAPPVSNDPKAGKAPPPPAPPTTLPEEETERPSTAVSFAPPPPAVDGQRPNLTALKPANDFQTTGSKPPPVAPGTRLLSPEGVSVGIDHQAIARIRSSDRRYARLTLELRDGRIMIGGQSADPATAWELADKIGPFAGKRNIVVGRITPP